MVGQPAERPGYWLSRRLQARDIRGDTIEETEFVFSVLFLRYSTEYNWLQRSRSLPQNKTMTAR